MRQRRVAAARATAPLMTERMFVARALAEKLHHSAQRPRMARAGEWGREMNFTATIRDPPPTPQPELFSLCEEELCGTRPDRIPTLSGPQERVVRRTVQQIVDDAVQSLPTLDDSAQQMVEQLVHFFMFFDALILVAEQVIDVPKISQDRTWQRLFDFLRQPQTAEQLVEVPTFQFLIVVVVGRVFKFLPRNRIQQRFVEQITLKILFRVLEVFKVSF